MTLAASTYTVQRKEHGHGYIFDPDIGEVPSVTQLLDPIIAKPFLQKWEAKQSGIGLIKLAQKLNEENVLQAAAVKDKDGELDVEKSWAKLRDWLKREHLRPQDNMQSAGDRGTAVHAAAELYGETGQIPDPNAAFPSDRPFVRAFVQFVEAEHPEIEQMEVVVGSVEHRYAGTFDAEARIGDELCLLDWKTSKRVYESHHVQLALYEAARREMGMTPTDRQYIVHLGADGVYEKVAVNCTVEQALAGVQWCHALSALNEQIKAAR